MVASLKRAFAAIAPVILMIAPLSAHAQETPWTAEPEPEMGTQAAPPATQPPQAKAPAIQPAQKAQGADTSRAGTDTPGDAKLRQRVEQLEEQIVDMQVVIGTLETLARGGNRPAASDGLGSSAGGGGDPARLDGIEMQIRALTTQVEQLSNEVKGQGGLPRRSDAAPPTGGVSGSYSQSPHGTPPAADGTSASRFGSTTVTSSSTDPIGEMAAGGASEIARSELPQAGAPQREVAAATPEATGGSNPKQLYEAAYGYLLQQDYNAAQSGFSDFLKKYPKDSLAPNALYWLGETHYVQRNFADAAEAFDLVTSSFGSSSKAPDAMLKRGMALAQLGKRQEACSALRSIGTKYPSAPPLVKDKAESERQRAGCP